MKQILLFILTAISYLICFGWNSNYNDTINIYIWDKSIPYIASSTDLPELTDSLYFDTTLTVYRWNELDSLTKFIKPVVDDFVNDSFKKNKIENLRVSFLNPHFVDSVGVEINDIPGAILLASSVWGDLKAAEKYSYYYNSGKAFGVIIYDNPDDITAKPILCFIIKPEKDAGDYYSSFINTGKTLDYKIYGPNYKTVEKYLYMVDSNYGYIYTGVVVYDSLNVFEYIFDNDIYAWSVRLSETHKLKDYRDKFRQLGIEVAK